MRGERWLQGVCSDHVTLLLIKTTSALSLLLRSSDHGGRGRSGRTVGLDEPSSQHTQPRGCGATRATRRPISPPHDPGYATPSMASLKRLMAAIWAWGEASPAFMVLTVR